MTFPEPARRQRSRNRLCPGFAPLPMSRRTFLRSTGLGFGSIALADLLVRSTSGQHLQLASHSPRAKNVIFLFMDGGVSHIDTFDYKPELVKQHGKPANLKADKRSQSAETNRVWLKNLWEFKQRGASGMWVSDLFPHLARCADDLCVVHSLVGEIALHGQQNLLLHTGRITGAAPSFGSWISYGLGTENQNLPGYILLNNDWVPNGGFQNFSASYLPATHEATSIRARGTPVDNIVPADTSELQQLKLNYLKTQDGEFARQHPSDLIESAIHNYETAARMQTLVPELCDVRSETKETLAEYGVDRTNDYDRFYALQCLRARRLVEAGVRFIEITCPLTHKNNAPWDQHGDLKVRHEENARITDQPVAALLTDLKRRGLLDETLVLCAGEMGRTPHSAGTDGRDHHVGGYTIWMAGGGLKSGITYGRTDELGMEAVENRIDIHDLHATILHQLGIRHEKLTFRFGGRDMRLTDVHGRVLNDLLI